MTFSNDEVTQIRTLIREEIGLLVDVPPPVAVAGPFPGWVKPADIPLGTQTDLAETRDVTEARSRALQGYTWRGNRAVYGKELDAAWAEVEAIKGLSQATVATYKRGRYAYLDAEFAIFAVLTGLIDLTPRLLMPAQSATQFAGCTVDSWLEEQFSSTGGPSGG